MADFPTLKTGAVMQYPCERQRDYATAVLRFVDGSEQRFPRYGRPLHRWVIPLDKLDDTEMARISEFFQTQRGRSRSFSFTDPWDNTVYPDCSVDQDELALVLTGEARGSTALTIRENR